MSFLASYKLKGKSAPAVSDGVLCPIPGRCRKCGAYLIGKCAISPGMGQCRFGYTVYYDERLGRVFFGARVEGFHDISRVTCTKVPVYLTQRQFATVVQYDSQKFELKQTEEIVNAFSRQYDSIIRQIKDALPNYDQESILHLPSATVERINDAVGALDDLKHSTESFVFQQTPYALLPTVPNIGNAVFQIEEVCKTCKKRSCEEGLTTEEFSCSMCQFGCSFGSYQHRRFRGLRIIGYYKKSLCKGSIPRKKIPRFDLAQFHQLIVDQVRQNEVLFSIRRFLHDIGQYLFGMGNLLPQNEHGRDVVVCSAADIRSIAAFVSALKSLKREYFRGRNPIQDTGRRIFEPFPLFYKYRLCFECKDVKIEVRDLDQESGVRSHEKIEGPAGFEFVTLNLISNAVKYLPRNTAEYRNIKIVLKKEKGDLLIAVSSFGPVVSKSELAHLGERGFRAGAARQVDESGQGLGLSRIVTYVHQAHFAIWFESGEGEFVCDDVQYSLFQVHIRVPAAFCRGVHTEDFCDYSSAASFE